MKTDHSEISQIQGCTNLKVRQLMRRITLRYDVHMSLVGLKTTQYSLLSFIEKLGPIRPSELAAHIKVDASTLTRNLKSLIDAGWVSLSAGSDARSRLVAITVEGAQKRAQAKRQWRKAQNEINQRLGIEQVSALHELIDKAMEKLPVDQAKAT